MSVQPKREPVDYLKEQFRQLEKVNSNFYLKE